MKYDGTEDPLEHLTAFEARMNLEGVGDEVRCRAFPVTLAGPAIRWFNNLPQGSVTQFSDISHAFLAQFTTRIVKAKHPIDLLGVTQRPGEPTRKYLDRFNDECLEIDGLTDSVASLCLTNGLSNENFRKHLTTKPVWTMQEIQCVAKEYINDEEVSRVVAANKRQPAYNQARHFEARERPKEHARDGGPSKPPKPFPRVGKFTNYTPLTASITEVYQQIAEKGILDALEQAIRDSKLADFAHLIREPRRRNRDHDTEDRSRPMRRRQEPEGDDHGLTVVNVVTARNTAPKSKSAQKKDAKVLAISTSPVRSLKGLPTISFGPEDQWFDEAPESPPMVITARVGTGLVKRNLVDTGADSNIMFRNVFDALGLRDSDLTTHQHGVVGLGDHFIKPDGIITLPTSVGQGQRRRTIMADFVILRDSTAYNIILGRKTINDLGAAISTKLLVMKFITDDGSVGSLRGDLETAVACDHASLSLRKKSKEASGVFLADLDARVDDKPRPEPEGDLEKFRVGEEDDKFTFINRNLPHEIKEPLMEMIRANADLFAWTPTDMPGIDPQLMSHHLTVKAGAKPVAQRRRKMSQERADEVAKQTASLLEAGFIRELDYSTWLSNVVLEILAAPPVLGKPRAGEPLYLYLSVTEEALAAVLVTEEAKTQQPVYFVSRALQGPELRYSKLERLALALLVSSRRLRQYFQSHRIVVRTDQAIRQILQKPDLAGRMMTWAIELSQYDLQYEPRHAIKAQAMADFLVEVKEMTSQFQEVIVQHVPRERNTRADLLSKLASTKPGSGNRSLIQGMVKEPTVALHLTESSPSWLDPITKFLELGKLPEDEKAAKALRREAARYAIIQGQLFKKGLSQPLLKYLHPDQTDYVLREVHEGCCGHHIGGKALARKLIRAGYYWPTMMKDSKEFVITRFGIPEVVISDNGTQFTDKKFMEFLSGLGIKQKFSSIEHPQTNGQVEAANKVVLLGLKKRLDSKKGNWTDELPSVLWSYRTTEQSATGETPFRLTYGVDAVILVEIGEPSPRLLLAGMSEAVEKDLIEETREMAHLTETALKQRIALRYNAKVLKREFEERDLVLRRNDIGVPTPGEGKLAVNWEGPYRVREVLGKGAYKLEKLDGKEIPRTWNAGNLKRFYS
ncbi:uncharacterized protein [Arachis hypogaea]|uniref:uncharacterized protein n=1 Tax=Arachis hypogaea TaxID=3818 RepID=UPI003B221356